MSEQNCLNCKYEPKWSEWSAAEYPRCVGDCSFLVSWPEHPKVFTITKKKVVRFSDDSGIIFGCPTWEPK